MAIQHRNDISWITFQLFDEYGITHGFFMRQGGCSPAPWKSLNMATSVGDSKENVLQNRRRISDAIGIDNQSFYDVWQIHGNTIIYADAPRQTHVPHLKGDAIATNVSNVTLLMLFADCVPVFIYDPKTNATMIIHAGWQGTIKAIVADAIGFMGNQFGSNKNDLIAGIGPSICLKHYEVGENVFSSARVKLGDNVIGLTQKGKYYLDLPATNKKLLQSEGIARIEMMNVCPACCTSDWFSHRGEEGKTGRFAGMIKPSDEKY